MSCKAVINVICKLSKVEIPDYSAIEKYAKDNFESIDLDKTDSIDLDELYIFISTDFKL